ncbi:hypothetical protein BB560_001668 [Smittium megazygosporum]|uniref:Uncharacterized protein n=1 Tax=Smittium megazygosporum TaxID=133381 RepID=A0A2T9ZGY1_9FUNG|nr:hypothetical protein BB560_001668 [Smittium megazygosporum]
MFTKYMMNELGKSSRNATSINRGFAFLSYGTTLLGDTFVIWTILLTLSGISQWGIDKRFYLFMVVSYMFILFETGTTKANVSTVIAEQANIGYRPTNIPRIYYDSRTTIKDATSTSTGLSMLIIMTMKYTRKNKSPHNEVWLDAAKGLTNVEWDDVFIEGLKHSIRAYRVFLFYPFYWALYNNMSDNFITRGLRMRRPK